MLFNRMWIFPALVIGSALSAQERIPFEYEQLFTPDASKIVSRGDRLVFGDVREEGMLSSWKKANWELSAAGVRAVGSRVSECEDREKEILERYAGDSYVKIRGYRVPWLTLSMGRTEWADYTVETTITPGVRATAGVAFRCLNSRQYYAFLLEKTGRASLVLRAFDREATPDKEAWTVLKSVPLGVTPGQAYRVRLDVDGTRMSCAVDGKILVECTDATQPRGKVALLADNPASFGPIRVKGFLVRQALPPLPVCARPERVHEVKLPKTDADRNFYFFDADNDRELEIIVAELKKDGNAIRCLEFDGTQLWLITGIRNRLTVGGDQPIQVFDINGDGRNELVYAADFQIQVRDAKTAKPLYAASVPPKNSYYGVIPTAQSNTSVLDDNEVSSSDLLLADALCPFKLDPAQPSGLYLKDRYTNLWVYDNRLNLKWHKAINTGHFPLPVDLNGDGRDELMACHTLFASDGTMLWNLPLSDHADNIAYESLEPGTKPKRIYIAHGEMGLLEIDPQKGELLNRLQYGHIQHISIADFLPEKPGLEIITQTLWREDRIHYFLDKDLKLLSTWDSDFGSAIPVPWGANGRDLPLTPTGILDPSTGRVVVPPFGDVLRVLDDPRWGNGVVMVNQRDAIHVFKAGGNLSVPKRIRPYQTIQSGYLPKVALPSK